MVQLRSNKLVRRLRGHPAAFSLLKKAWFGASRLSPFVSLRYVCVGGQTYLDLKTGRRRRLQPNLVVIGAQRAGTTSLHAWLAAHPDIFMSNPVKEPCFFATDLPGERRFAARARDRGWVYSNQAELLKTFMLQGYLGEPVIGESSTYYSMDMLSRSHDMARAVAAGHPQMRVIYLVRNPLDRIVSHHLCRPGGRGDDGLDAFVETTPAALTTSRYAFQLAAYRKHLPDARIAVVVFEELLADPVATLNGLAGFLGLPPATTWPSLAVHNAGPARESVASHRRHFSRGTYDSLMATIEPDVRRLEAHLGRSLDRWDLSAGRWCG